MPIFTHWLSRFTPCISIFIMRPHNVRANFLQTQRWSFYQGLLLQYVLPQWLSLCFVIIDCILSCSLRRRLSCCCCCDISISCCCCCQLRSSLNLCNNLACSMACCCSIRSRLESIRQNKYFERDLRNT